MARAAKAAGKRAMADVHSDHDYYPYARASCSTLSQRGLDNLGLYCLTKQSTWSFLHIWLPLPSSFWFHKVLKRSIVGSAVGLYIMCKRDDGRLLPTREMMFSNTKGLRRHQGAGCCAPSHAHSTEYMRCVYYCRRCGHITHVQATYKKSRSR